MGYKRRVWTVELHSDFEAEFDGLPRDVRLSLIALLQMLEEEGPLLGRPYVDTLKGSAYPNMKELRLDADGGVWRVAFAFDPRRRGIVLVAGDKRGQNQNRFYKSLIRCADKRFTAHTKKAGEK